MLGLMLLVSSCETTQSSFCKHAHLHKFNDATVAALSDEQAIQYAAENKTYKQQCQTKSILGLSLK